MEIKRVKSNANIHAEGITEFKDFSVGDTVNIQIKGVITQLGKVDYDGREEPTQDLSVDIEKIYASHEEVGSVQGERPMEKAEKKPLKLPREEET